MITGGAGFMGSNVVQYLLKKYPKCDILNFDKLTYCGNLENLHDIEKNPHYKFVRGDIADQKKVEEVFKEFQPDAVLNYAAETHVDRSIMQPKAFLETEIIGTYTLLEAVRTHGTEKFIQVSTDEVFGSTEEGSFNEKSPFLPNSPYAAAKAGADHLCRAYFVTYHTPVIVTHSCNFYGPYQYPEKFISLGITNLLEGKSLPVYGDGANRREWIFTVDHCRALDVILQKGKIGEVYNIGTGAEFANIEIAKKICQLLEVGEDKIEFVKDRPGHDWRYAIDHTKITRELGWQPEVDFGEGLRQTVEWYKNNKAWWKRIKSGEFLEYYRKQYSS